MKYYQINAVHDNSIIEEVLSVTIEAENAKEARDILEKNGFSVIDIDDDFEKIRVRA